MKIKVGNKVYLQKYDVSYILRHLNDIPVSFIGELFKESKPFLISNQNDALEFAYAFKNPMNTEWLMSQDYILDYESTIFVSLSATKDYYKGLKKELNKEIRNFNTKDPKYRTDHYDEYSEKFKRKQHKIESYRIMIDCLNGKINFVFPDEIYSQIDHPAISKKKPSFFARLFGRSAR